MKPYRLSKSRYMSGHQCHLRLWYDTHKRHLVAPASETLQATFDTGNEVGRLACELYPRGHLVAQGHRSIPQALAETRRLIRSGEAHVLYEPAFRHGGVLVRVDILERLETGGWRMVEVKSTTRLKEQHIRDAAVQFWVLQGAGIDVMDAGVLTLNRGYVYDGERLDLEKLFTLHPVYETASEMSDEIGADASEMLAMLATDDAPEIDPGPHCFRPYHCPYYEHCTRDAPNAEYSIAELPRLTAERRAELEVAGVSEIRDVPDGFPLNDLQTIVRKAVSGRRAIVHGDLAGSLTEIEKPIRYLDFETFQPAVPRFRGTRCYDQIPFMFSVHRDMEGSEPEHIDYLHGESDDPRPALAERLIDALGDDGSICVYSGFERTVIRTLAADLPQYAEVLNAIAGRLVDLLPVVRNGYYHPDFRGSFSIKSVLPVITPDLGYDDLEIADGRLASVSYARALASADIGERNRVFDSLRAYCARDTLAMLEMRKALLGLASTEVGPHLPSQSL